MKERLNKTLNSIEISGIRKFNQLASEYENVIKLTLGEPDFFVPDAIKNATIEAVNNDFSKYTKNQGIEPLLEGIARYLSNQVGLSYQKTNIIATVGATGALQVTLASILNPEDEVILLTPSYPGYAPLIKLNHAETKCVNSIEGIDGKSLMKEINKRTKAILITSPNNPTGYVYSQSDFDVLFEVARENDLFIVWDAIYLDLIYDQTQKIFVPQDMIEHLILIGGFSKSHAMTGYRLGFLAAGESIRRELLKTQQYTVTSASSIVQYAGVAALNEDNHQMVESYKERRDYLMNELNRLGIPFIKPGGAFYIFIDVSRFKMNGIEFATKLLEEQQVACVPGSYFTGDFDQYIRVSYATDLNKLQIAIKRLELFIAPLV